MDTKDMACHTWAINGSTAIGKGEQTNKDYVDLMNTIGAKYNYGSDLKGKSLSTIRQETMEEILQLCKKRTQGLSNKIFLSGGFREGQVCPEHLWLEDHTNGKTYDTFIDQDVIVVNRVGIPGNSFQPGCEASPFLAGEIARVQLNGFTNGQYYSLPS